MAGTGSGVGKTSIALALVSALRRRGLAVQAFKVGPDYLDPTYLEIASGRPCYNLDGWMCGKEYVRRLFARKAAEADVSVIEGVMGLFDGSDPVAPDGSTAEIAAWLDAPVILVANVHGVARSVSAMVKGYAQFEPGVRVKGIVANQCGSERHGYWLGESLKGFGLPGLVASPPRGAFPELPSRHLGLVTADEFTLPRSVLDQLGDALERHGSVDDILAIARSAPDPPADVLEARSGPTEKKIRLGLAYDAAFHFYYEDNLDALQEHGCELVRFSPLEDEALPEGLHGLYIGGGYPEEHAEALSKNRGMSLSVKRFAESGRPVYGECGGLMYLSEGIESVSGERFTMVGLLPAWTRMLERLKSLGYVEVTFQEDSLFGDRGARLRGHEFHYSELTGDPTAGGLWKPVYSVKRMRSDGAGVEGFQRGRILVSYVHAHFGSRPKLVEHFVTTCAHATDQG